jgi:hypothetical protein
MTKMNCQNDIFIKMTREILELVGDKIDTNRILLVTKITHRIPRVAKLCQILLSLGVIHELFVGTFFMSLPDIFDCERYSKRNAATSRIAKREQKHTDTNSELNMFASFGMCICANKVTFFI